MPKKSVVESVLSQDSSHFGPIITKFNHGSLNSDSNFRSVNLAVSNSKEDGRSFDLTLKTDKLTYSSDVPSAQCSKSVPSRKVYIALRNKHTRKVRLVESSVVSLGPQITARATSNPLLCKEEDTGADSWLSSRKELVNLFGQERRKRFLDQADKMKVKEDNYAHKMSDAVANANFDGTTVEEVESMISMIPPINRKAKSVGDVYDINTIISPTDMEALNEASEKFFSNYKDAKSIEDAMDKNEISRLGGFLIRKMTGCASSTAISGTILYIEGLLIFSKLKEQLFKKGSLSCLPSFLPGFVRRNIYTQFSDDGKLTPMARDKALCHAIVLALLSVEYRFDFKDLLTSVKVPPTKLRMLVSCTGATIVTDKVMNVTEVSLKLPLSSFDFSKVTRKKKKGKK